MSRGKRNSPTLKSNIFQSEFKFNEKIEGMDFFKVDGAFPRKDKYKLVGKALYKLQRLEDVPLAKYFPNKKDDYIIGFLSDEPKKKKFSSNGLNIKYMGKKDLVPGPSSYRAFIELLYKAKKEELKERGYWNFIGNTMFPPSPKNLDDSRFKMFRGPTFNYYINNKGEIKLVIDTTTHYIKSEPFLEEIKRRGENLEWFEKEIEENKKRLEGQGRKSKGIYFYYSLTNSSVPIDGVYPRPIDEIPLKIPNRNFDGTVAEYLEKNYDLDNLDKTQPALLGGKYKYPPQMLHRNVSLDEIPSNLKRKESHLEHIPNGTGKRDPNRPARIRDGLIEREFDRRFKTVNIGPKSISFTKYKEREIQSFDKPSFILNEEKKAVKFDDIEKELKAGGYNSPELDNIFMFSINERLTEPIWNNIKNNLKEYFGWDPTIDPFYFGKNYGEIKAYLKKKKDRNEIGNSIAICIIEENSSQHDDLNKLFGNYNISVQCIEESTAKDIVDRGKSYHLSGICAGIYSKGGGIPWLLYNDLNYERYGAIDIGREKSEAIGIGIVYDKKGTYDVIEGDITIGEDIDEQSIEKCVDEATRGKDCKDFILLRDGDIPSKSEIDAFKSVTDEKPIQNCAIVYVKKDIPHRIFRKERGRIKKPQSGDYLLIDENEALLCFAGEDEYTQAMPQPKAIEVIETKGDIDTIEIAEDLFSLSYLNWGSPGRSYSLPAPLKLADEMARELSRGIRPAGPPF